MRSSLARLVGGLLLVVLAFAGARALRDTTAERDVRGTLALAAETAALESAGLDEAEASGRSTPGVGRSPVAAPRSSELLVRVLAATDGRPLAGATVYGSERSDEEHGDELLRELELETDAQGEALLPPGLRDEVQVWLPGHVSDRPTLEDTQQELEFRMWPAVRTEVLVVDSRTGSPLNHVRVVASQEQAAFRSRSYLRTDGTGTTLVEHLAGNMPMKLSCRCVGYEHREWVVADPAAEPRLRLELDPLSLVVGTVSWDDGMAVEGAKVALVVEGDSRGARSGRGETTGFDGRFALENVPRNVWCRLQVRSLGNGVVQSGAAFRIQSAGERVQCDVTLAGARGALEVVAVDEYGSPRAGARVYIRREERLDSPRPNPQVRRNGSNPVFRTTDEEGRARCADLPAGTYRIGVSSDGAAEWSGVCEVVPGKTTVAWAEVARAVPLRVIVLAADGEPLPGIDVRFEEHSIGGAVGAEDSGSTNAQGLFASEGFTGAPGTFRVECWSAGDGTDHTVWVAWEGVRAGPAEQVFRLPQPTRVRGRFATPPVRGEQFNYSIAWGPEGEGLAINVRLEVAADGSFEERLAIPDGLVNLGFSRPLNGRDEGFVFRNLSLSPGAVLDLGTVDEPRGVTVEGRVLDADGEPLDGAFARIEGPNPFEYQVVNLGAGHFRFESVPPGTYELIGGAEGHRPTRLRVQVPEEGGGLGGLELRIERPARLQGRIHSGSTTHSGCHTLYLECDSDERLSTPIGVDPNGGFDQELSAGTFHVWYRAFGDLEWVRGPIIALAPGESRELELELP